MISGIKELGLEFDRIFHFFWTSGELFVISRFIGVLYVVDTHFNTERHTGVLYEK